MAQVNPNAGFGFVGGVDRRDDIAVINASCVLMILLKQHGLKKVQAAHALQVTDRALDNYIKRKRRPPMHRMGKLCDMLGVPTEALVDQEGYLRHVGRG